MRMIDNNLRRGNASGRPYGNREDMSGRRSHWRGGTDPTVVMSFAFLLATIPANANEDLPVRFPETKRIDVVEERFGIRISDPYRWLENDLRGDSDVADWVKAQDLAARSYLSEVPGREVFRERLRILFGYERLTTPERRGNRFFFTRNTGLDNQDVLIVRDGMHGTDRVLLDPNQWSEGGDVAMAEWDVSEDASHVAFAMQDGGNDWRTIRVLDVETGAFLENELSWVRFSAIAWAKDGSGFFYSRFPEPKANAGFEARVEGHAVYFHKLGAPQAEDRLIYGSPEGLPIANVATVTEDGRYAVIYSSPGAGGNALRIVDLADPTWTPRVVVEGMSEAWSVIGNIGTKFFLTTQKGAERGKIVVLELADNTDRFVDLVPEREDALSAAYLVGGRLLVSYLDNAKTTVRRFRLDGTPDGIVDLPGIGTAGGFRGRAEESEAFFVFTSHDAPTTIYRYDVAANTKTVWAEPRVGIDLDRIVVEQHLYPSKDGTRIPMFVIRRKDVAGPVPTMLYGYGGFGISMVPYYSPEQLAWVEQGGAYAVANIRGGGEYGKAWHDAGRLANKQTSFDDFIAAGEFLKRQGIATPDGLAIQGQSNGGLLVGAVVNQRPDLFAAALPGVGVMDMLRFNLFTGGQLWMQDFGDPAKEDDFKRLLAYSPLHNIRSGVDYPAILTTTADTDNRVIPGHSFKYVAALQAAEIGDRPQLLRVDMRAGHGAGKPTEKVIDEVADLWAFAARWTGLRVEAVK